MSVVRNPAELLVPGRPLTLASVADVQKNLPSTVGMLM